MLYDHIASKPEVRACVKLFSDAMESDEDIAVWTLLDKASAWLVETARSGEIDRSAAVKAAKILEECVFTVENRDVYGTLAVTEWQSFLVFVYKHTGKVASN